MKKSYLGIAALAVVFALAVAACGGGSSSSGGGGTESAGGYSYGRSAGGATSDASETEEAVPVSLGEAAGAGKVLVDAEGMTLYYFVKDGKGSGVSKCEGPCAAAWPPLTGSEAEAMSGIEASMLGTIERPDGTTQVTYAGWPLYTYAGDSNPGEDNGTDLKDFGAPWYPLHANGEKAGE